jgi:hypothetical protein
MEQSRARITYIARPDATPEAELSTLANVYRFILDCHAKKRGRILDKSGPDDARKDQDAGTYPHYT